MKNMLFHASFTGTHKKTKTKTQTHTQPTNQQAPTSQNAITTMRPIKIVMIKFNFLFCSIEE